MASHDDERQQGLSPDSVGGYNIRHMAREINLLIERVVELERARDLPLVAAIEKLTRAISQSRLDQATLAKMAAALDRNTAGIVEAQQDPFRPSENLPERRSILMAGATKQEVLDKIAEQTTIVAGLAVYNEDLHQRLHDALDAGSLVTQADLDQIFADVAANNQVVAQAMIDNVT